MRYTTIVADPPWPYDAPGQFGCTLEHRPNRDKTLNCYGAGSRRRYGALSMDNLLRLPVGSVAADPAHLYLWFTNSFAEEAHVLARAWGFDPKTILTWVKTRHADGQPSMKMGWYFRGATEHVLFAVRGSLRLKTREAIATAFLSPRLPHSRKPDSFFALVEKASPGPYLELFARRARPGWAAWGNEAPGSVALPGFPNGNPPPPHRGAA